MSEERTGTNRTSLALSYTEMDRLRQLAADLGLNATRGPMAGRIGNATALMSQIAAAYERDPAAAVRLIRELTELDA